MSSKFYTQPVKETPLWEDRRRRLPFGWPLSFTKYILTDVRLKINNGFLNRREETIQLYRITDVSLRRSLGERLCRTGTVIITSGDATTPIVRLRHIKHPGKARDLLLQTVEAARKAAGVSTAEIVGGGGILPPRGPAAGPGTPGAPGAPGTPGSGAPGVGSTPPAAQQGGKNN